MRRTGDGEKEEETEKKREAEAAIKRDLRILVYRELGFRRSAINSYGGD